VRAAGPPVRRRGDRSAGIFLRRKPHATQQPHIVFDIETSAQPLENFDETQQEYLFRETEKIDDATAKAAKREEITKFMSLWPFTSQVVCIAMLNAETQRGQSLCSSRMILRTPTTKMAPVDSFRARTRPNCSPQFWDVAKNTTIVTFNGRGFDVPFIYLRSALLNVPISKKNWLGYRYAVEPHCDLAEQFTFYSVSGRDGAARRFNLDFYCKAFGIESPKSAGVTGMRRDDADGRGKFREIAEYCLRDVRATVELYKIWKERLAGIGLNPDLKLGDVVFENFPGSSRGDEAQIKKYLEPPYVGCYEQLIAAGAMPAKFFCADHIATTVAEKQALRARTGADAVEMESGAIQSVCAERGIPCVTVRVISDPADETLPLDFNALAKPDRSMDFGKLAWAIAKSPWKISALIRLQKKAKFAARQLAAVLTQILPSSH
jgi:hypothetical protein